MCGIAGYVGQGPAVRIALDCLARLEYRGYDSAGIAFTAGTGLSVVKTAGKVDVLARKVNGGGEQSHTAVAHTRWATHGRPTDANAHPHSDCTGEVAVVHNGIIENFRALRERLSADGHLFVSETDTEVIAHLVEDETRTAHTPEQFAAGCRRALAPLSGSYAVVIVSQRLPEALFVARQDSPLVIGLGQGERIIASDIPALLGRCRHALCLRDGDLAIVEADRVTVLDRDGLSVERAPLEITCDTAAAEKDVYRHFMLKEIYEGPRTVRDTLAGRIDRYGRVDLRHELGSQIDWTAARRVSIVACGTAFHAGLVAQRTIERLCRIPTVCTVASEFRYGDPIVDRDTLVILISQSGETADTLAGLAEARARGARTLAIVNATGSRLAREADLVLYTHAGPEIGVASTKAYLAQLSALSLVALDMAQSLGTGAPEREGLAESLMRGPSLVERALEPEPAIRAAAEDMADMSCFFFVGRGYDSASAMEGALKLKEISYIHAEAYPAGELKHGPLALVEPGVAVVGLATQPRTHAKLLSNLEEARARQGAIACVLRSGLPAAHDADWTIPVPDAHDSLMPLTSMPALQLLAYHVALARGCPIDQPRNLAKSVTVE